VDTCVDGIQHDNAVWEEWPDEQNAWDVFNDFPVSPGNTIAAYVYELNNGQWETVVENLSTGLTGIMVTGEGWGVSSGGPTGSFIEQGSTADLSYSGGYTAEWIVEDYTQVSVDGPLEPFADYGTVTFTGITTSLSSWGLTANEAIGIEQNGKMISTPSAPSGDGFSVSYTG